MLAESSVASAIITFAPDPLAIAVAVIRAASVAAVGALTTEVAPQSVRVASVVLGSRAGERRWTG
jgi:hypothetical protein